MNKQALNEELFCIMELNYYL